jgi:hypothetical protein
VPENAETLALEVMDRIRTHAPLWLLARTVAILVEDEHRGVSQLGTGILLAIADEVFVVSAAHVLTDARYYPLWINPVADRGSMIPIAREVASSNDATKVDFGFFKVPDQYIKELAAAKEFVRLNQIAMQLPSAHWYAVLGFPAELNVFRSVDAIVPATPLYYATRLHDIAADPIADFDPVINIALELALHRSGDAVTKQLSLLPDFRGMSGAGIWQLHDLRQSAMTWTVDRIRLAGIFHTRAGDAGPFKTQSGDAAIVGVHFAHIANTIRTAFRRLAPVIDLSRRT